MCYVLEGGFFNIPQPNTDRNVDDEVDPFSEDAAKRLFIKYVTKA